MGPVLVTSGVLIERATRAALMAAEERRLTSIAFPALGTGVGGFPVRDGARIMIEAVRGHASPATRLVRFVLFGQPAYRAFVDVAGALLGPALDGPLDCPISG